MRLLAWFAFAGLIACQPKEMQVEDIRVPAVEKRDQALEERVARLERDLAEARALIAQETADRVAAEAKLTAILAEPAPRGSPDPWAAPTRSRSRISGPGF